MCQHRKAKLLIIGVETGGVRAERGGGDIFIFAVDRRGVSTSKGEYNFEFSAKYTCNS
jgi:hypothetical protein